ncbi:MAG: hypothetical protein JO180_00040 [Gemmatirosa sp.]|nr:hypothetical protein [Gemmatirosa sp.]
MPGHYDQIVIGAGASGLSFLYAADHGARAREFSPQRTLVLGGRDLWGRGGVSSGGDSLGQSPDILHTIDRQAAPASNLGTRTGDPRPGAPARQFQTIGAFNTQKDALKQRVLDERHAAGKTLEFQDLTVTAVRREGATIRVAVAGDSFTATQVVIASGPGGARVPDVANPSNIAGATHLRAGQIVDANSYLWEAQPARQTVCVEGGSATASWCVQRAIERNARAVLWVSRSGFLAANPAGRNSETIQQAIRHGWMRVGRVERIAVSSLVPLGSAHLLGQFAASVPATRLTLTLAATTAEWTRALGGVVSTDGKSAPQLEALAHNLVSRGPTAANTPGALQIVAGSPTFEVDQYVYAAGQDPGVDLGAGRFIEQDLAKELAPRFDASRFGHEQTVVAFATPRDWPCSLWLVGSAVFQSLGNKNIATLAKELQKSYAEMSDVLCKENSPPEGVPLVNASLNALMDITQPTGDAEFNWKTANLVDLEAYLTRRWGPNAANPQGIVLSPLAIQDAARDIANAQRATSGGFSKMQWELVLKSTVAKYGGRVLRATKTVTKGTGYY